MINKGIHQITVLLKITFKRFKSNVLKAFRIVERREKLSNKTPYHRKILIVLLITIRSDLVRFKQILYFSKIEGSITTET